jgi:hypothetical protein
LARLDDAHRGEAITTTNLRAVSCSSATACVAVGIATVVARPPLVEAFSG